MIARRATLAALVALAATRIASACPACAANGDSPTRAWAIAMMIALPVVMAGLVVAWVHGLNGSTSHRERDSIRS